MQFDLPVELVRGEVVEMPRPELRHGVVCGNVGFPLSAWARSAGNGLVAFNDAGVITRRKPDTVRGPDVMFIPMDRLPDGRVPAGLSDLVPSLVVEVRSPSDRWKNIHEKISEYFERGVAEVWVVDYLKRRVHVFRADDDPIILAEGDIITSESVLPGFSCEVSGFFAGL
ncbi:MAG: Uma2 family endonuclease [Planctomycetaceae bacterium]|nr:Uma2 family endonuclease [Planctomycetaceae bacterium]